MKITNNIELAPLSEKHIEYINRTRNCYMSVAEGAVRAGKTIDNCIAAAVYLETCKDKIHLASGASVPNAMLNIGECNGFGLAHLFRGRCRWGKYLGNDALYINPTKTGQKIVVFAGGGKADSYKKIQGNSYGLWIATEIANHHDSDDHMGFISMAFSRQLAANERKVLWDLNPNGPMHPIYSRYIDKYKEISDKIGGYNYGHFTIDDNTSLTEEQKERFKMQWPSDSFMYRRNILGERVNAEGLIYNNWDIEAFDVAELKRTPNVDFVYGLDFGFSNSPTAFIAAAVNQNTKEIHIYDEFYKTKQTNDMVADTLKARGYANERIICDSAEPKSVAELKRHGIPRAQAVGSKDILFGIQFIQQFRIIVHPNCKNTVAELSNYCWDSASNCDRPIKESDHLMDALRYACERLTQREVSYSFD